MSTATTWDVLGWTGNVCFFSRFFVQWYASERAKRSVAPASFWWLSLAGTVGLGLYAWHCRTYVLVAGYVINGLIYLRNLMLQNESQRGLPRSVASVLAVSMALALVVAGVYELRHREESALIWIVVAAIGQAFWSARFVVQWWAAERAGESHFPRIFWWLSLVGNSFLLAFALHLGDAKFIAGFVPGPLVQIRNLMLGRRSTSAAGRVDS